MTWIKKLHWQIVISLVLGLVYGILATKFGWLDFTKDWIAPFGTIFISLLKLCAVPLVIVSLICGVASLSDTSKLSHLGVKTIITYIATTAIAITIGLILVNILNPGSDIDKDVAERIQAAYSSNTESVRSNAASVKDRSPLKPLVDMVPDNPFQSVSDNKNLLQIVFISIFFGVTLVIIPKRSSRPVIDVFNGLNACLVKAVKIVILLAPLGVFSLLAGAITTAGSDAGEVLGSLGKYALTVVLALIIHGAIVYPSIVQFLTPVSVVKFFKSIWPAQTLAFSTSSSAAALPITMERCQNELKVSKENSSFILPLGATINMDGTALYQAIAVVFLANVFAEPLTLGAQFSVLVATLLASIGTAAVPSAGLVMLTAILVDKGIPAEAVGLIWALDRPLDMLRTAVNVTGDAAVATFISSSDISDKDRIDYGSRTPGQRDGRRRPPRRRYRPNNQKKGNDNQSNSKADQNKDSKQNYNPRRRRPNSEGQDTRDDVQSGQKGQNRRNPNHGQRGRQGRGNKSSDSAES